MRAEARDAFERDLKKREELAMNRLQAAKEQAVEEVRNLAIDIALKTTEKILIKELDGEKGDRLILEQIDALPSLLSEDFLKKSPFRNGDFFYFKPFLF